MPTAGQHSGSDYSRKLAESIPCAECGRFVRYDQAVQAPANSKHADKMICRRCLNMMKPGPSETKSR